MYQQHSGATAEAAPSVFQSTPARATAAVIHYTMYLPDGNSVSSHELGHPFRFQLTENDVIPGLMQAVATMHVGETRRIQLTPRQAFGERRPERVVLAEHHAVHAPVELRPGMPVQLALHDTLEQAFVRAVEDEGVIFDMNHPLAGLEITMDVTLVAYE